MHNQERLVDHISVQVPAYICMRLWLHSKANLHKALSSRAISRASRARKRLRSEETSLWRPRADELSYRCTLQSYVKHLTYHYLTYNAKGTDTIEFEIGKSQSRAFLMAYGLF